VKNQHPYFMLVITDIKETCEKETVAKTLNAATTLRSRRPICNSPTLRRSGFLPSISSLAATEGIPSLTVVLSLTAASLDQEAL
jgi:hypothetical protein